MQNVLNRSKIKPWLMPTTLALCDLAISAIIILLCVYARHLYGGDFQLEFYWAQWPIFFIYIGIIASFGGYDILVSPPQELRSCTLSTVLFITLLSAVTFWLRTSLHYSRMIFIISGILLFVFIPVAHFSVRAVFSKFGWCRFPAILYVFEKRDIQYIRSLLSKLRGHLDPVLILRHRPEFLCGSDVDGIPVQDGPTILTGQERCPHGFFVFLGYPSLGLGARSVLAKAERVFARSIILHESLNFGNQWAKAVDIGRFFGLQVMQRLLGPKRLFAKTLVDFCLSVFFLILMAPFFVLIAILIKLSSPGPIFFQHTRLGRNGKIFKAWKFRTLVCDADIVLQELLEKDPEARALWNERHKLSVDPRVTAVGRFLRRTSIDELPQLFNVVRGEMSLIGPRPIVQEEVEKYGEHYQLISRVRPGLTGLWQVSGRSRLTYAERVEIDAYYIRNWSFWLDMYILLKTPVAVLSFSNAA